MSNLIEVNENSMEYQAAVQLHREIITNGNIAASALLELCKGLKKMRDERLYLQLGYEDFDGYVEEAVGIKKRQAYTYISTYERLGETVLKNNALLGISKLDMLASVSPDDRAEILGNGDLQEMSAKEVKALVDSLKSTGEQLSMMEEQNKELKCQASEVEDLRREVQELRNRPIDVAVQEPDAATIKKIKSDARKEAEAALQEKIKKETTKAAEEARALGLKEGEAKVKQSFQAVESEKAEAIRKAEELEKKLKIAANPDSILFSHLFEELQTCYNKLIGCVVKLDAADPATAEKFRGALKKYIAMMEEKLK